MPETGNANLKINKEMIEHKKKVMELHHECMAACQRGDIETAKKLMAEMRGIHGCAVYDNWMAVKHMKKAVKQDEEASRGQQGGHNIPEAAWIGLSLNDSFLAIIRDLIHTCQLELWKHTGMGHNSMAHDSMAHNSMGQSSFAHASNTKASSGSNAKATIRTNSAGIHELSIEAPKTETGPFSTPYLSTKYESGSMFEPNIPAQTGGHHDPYSDGLSDYINNMTGGEYDRVMDQYGGHDNDYDYNRPKYGGHGDSYYDRPMYGGHGDAQGTGQPRPEYEIAFYWLTKCPASQDAKPVWEKFSSVMGRLFPGFPIKSLNVDHGQDANRKAAVDAGVKTVPTVVFYHNGKPYLFPLNKDNIALVQNAIAEKAGKLSELKDMLKSMY